MPRNMSFSMTTEQIRNRTKTVTRYMEPRLEVGDKIEWSTWYDEKICFMTGEVTSIGRDFCQVIGWDMTGQFRLKDRLSMDSKSVKRAVLQKSQEE